MNIYLISRCTHYAMLKIQRKHCDDDNNIIKFMFERKKVGIKCKSWGNGGVINRQFSFSWKAIIYSDCTKQHCRNWLNIECQVFPHELSCWNQFYILIGFHSIFQLFHVIFQGFSFLSKLISKNAKHFNYFM